METLKWEGETFRLVGVARDPADRRCDGCGNVTEDAVLYDGETCTAVWCKECLAEVVASQK